VPLSNAQSLTFPLSFQIIGIQVGLGIAIAALISRARSLHFLATTAKGKYWTIENSHNS